MDFSYGHVLLSWKNAYLERHVLQNQWKNGGENGLILEPRQLMGESGCRQPLRLAMAREGCHRPDWNGTKDSGTGVALEAVVVVLVGHMGEAEIVVGSVVSTGLALLASLEFSAE